MRHSEALDQLAVALVKANEDFPAIVKDATNPHFGSRYASLGAIVDAVRPVLAQHGVTVVQSGGMADDAGTEIVTRLLHQSGQWIDTVVRMPFQKANAQGAGSALTYGRRYGLAAALNIVADDDDDGNAAVGGKAPEQKPVQATKAAPPAAKPAQRPSASGAVMPFGNTKGTPLSELSVTEIEGAYAWARDKNKFEEFQKEAEAELQRRHVPATTGFDQMPDALQGDDGPPEWL